MGATHKRERGTEYKTIRGRQEQPRRVGRPRNFSFSRGEKKRGSVHASISFFNCILFHSHSHNPAQHMQCNRNDNEAQEENLRPLRYQLRCRTWLLIFFSGDKERLGCYLLCFRLDSVKSEDVVVALLAGGSRWATGAEVDNFPGRKWKFGPRKR